jgi:hypothetical protein
VKLFVDVRAQEFVLATLNVNQVFPQTKPLTSCITVKTFWKTTSIFTESSAEVSRNNKSKMIASKKISNQIRNI